MRSLTRNTQWFLSIGIASTMVVTSCSDAAEDAERAADTAQARFLALEQRLLGAESVHIRGAAGSTGAVISGLEGEAVLASGNRAHLQFSGEFGGAGVTLAFVADGDQMWGGNGTDQFQSEVPSSLNEGVLLGFTRMGILHNLALLSSASPPDGTDGAIRDWVTVSNFGWGESGELDGVAAETVTFDLTVNGTPAAKVILWLEQETGLPVQREQMVQFPDGEMRAVEIYEAVEIDAPFEPEKFVIP